MQKTYVNRQGHSIGFQSPVPRGKFKFDTAKTMIRQEKAIVLFLHRYKADRIIGQDNRGVLSPEYTNGSHAVAAGYLEVNYTPTDNTTRTDRYRRCSPGVGLYLNGYVNIALVDATEAPAITLS